MQTKANETAFEKENLFDRWCTSQKVESKEHLRQLILLEEFKNCLPEVVSVYLNEQKAVTLEQAAILADEFILTHKVKFGDKHSEVQDQSKHKRSQFVKSVPSGSSPANKMTKDGLISERACFYCKRLGHLIADCPVLSKKHKSAKTVAFVSPVPSLPLASSVANVACKNRELAGSSSFLMDGCVCLSSDPENRQAVKIWRDTGAFQSVILYDVLSFNEKSAQGSEVIVKGFGGGFLSMPLHSINLQSDLVSGDVVVALCSQIPIDGVSFILGNDLAGGKVLAVPEVISTVLKSGSPDELELAFPETFPVCATTRAMSVKRHVEDKSSNSELVIPLYDTFMVLGDMNLSASGKMFPSREQLILEQKQDSTLSPMFEDLVSDEVLPNVASGYFVSDGVLMRKWTDPKISREDDWSSVFQVVVPEVYRSDILYLAHDHCLSGHLGVRKTLDRVLRHFYWPGVRSDVAQYCRSCHVCQVVGKPNQSIPAAPLHPIPAIGEPFEHVLIDCVGPLPRTKSGNQYLLTIMCATTRFPEAVPLRKITAPAISKALIKFFTVFGLPRVVQSDQGSNFMSRLFSQLLKQFSIQHNVSSAYHPESQGALERFHQTLKTMLKTYCKEFERDWDDGVPLLLFAVREVVQESLGFSPAELVFGHTVRGPLKLVKEKWLDVERSTPTNLLDYVSNFRFRLSRACELAKENLKAAQEKMKTWYDRKAKHRVFCSGDQVLVLLPILGSALQAQYSGPYTIDRKVGECNYLVKTPNRKRKTRMCHVNLLKPYFDRNQTASTEVKALAALNAPTTETVEGVAVYEIARSRLPNSEILAKLDFHLSYLNLSERSDVIQLIYQYSALFSDVPSCTNVLEHDIDVGQVNPIKQHPYRVNPVKRQLLRKEVEYMLEHNIAEPTCSAWSSPCLLVEKHDGSFRFCTDFRKVNAITKPDSFPLPRLDDCIDQVGSASFVSKLDLLKGYWQVPLSQRAREISAFVTPDNFCQYNVMAFGMRNAPATFQRLVNKVLEGVAGCEAYLDDVVIYSSTWSQHLAQLGDVFKRLKAANLTLNLSKCEFGQATVTYLGKVVGHGHVSPVGAKVEAIVNFCCTIISAGTKSVSWVWQDTIGVFAEILPLLLHL
uniref:Gypsy retrotransposon integrase-like protein 1 n=1 Tax=Cyprinus carpio carpio TaxID=630221 RepID=A0A9J8CV35_CYPCA